MTTEKPSPPARPIARHYLTGTLIATTALRVGGWGSTLGVDLPVLRDGAGRVVLPGTSLAGSLRSWLTGLSVSGTGWADRVFDEEVVRSLFGDLTTRTTDGKVCRILVDDAIAAAGTTPSIRDGVGIDRRTGSAARNQLYQHEVIPAGTCFPFRIVGEEPPDDDTIGLALQAIRYGLSQGLVHAGAATTRGLGGLRLADAEHRRIDLTDPQHIVDWLKTGKATPWVAPDLVIADARLTVTITWRPVTPVMVRASTVSKPTTENPPDTVPLLDETDGVPLLPGSSVKGVLRGHAERIVRSVRDFDAGKKWPTQLNDSHLDVVLDLFGEVGDANAATGRKGALCVEDCSVADQGTLENYTHVAIDRWTGGAAENLLFSVSEPLGATWHPLILRLDTARLASRLDENGQRRALVLLLLVLRDLANGWMAFGYGTTRGRGSITVDRVELSAVEPTGIWAELFANEQAAQQPHIRSATLDDAIKSVPHSVDVWKEWACQSQSLPAEVPNH